MKNLLLYPALALTLLFNACDEGENFNPIPTPNNDPKSSNEYLTVKVKDMLQEFTVDMSQAPVTIETEGGITITIPDGAFTIGGVPVDGEVDIRLYEMLSKSSIVFSGTNTNFSGRYEQRYFETDGFFNIQATADGVAVDEYLAQYLRVTVPKVFNPDRDWTLVWFGTETAGENGDQFAWTDELDDDEQWRGGEAWTQLEDFEFHLGKLGWCNCDMYWDGDRTTVTVELTGTFGKFASYFAMDGDTYVFFCGKKSSVMAQLYNVVDESTVESYKDSMPKGEEGRLFAFSVTDGVYTYAEKEITIEAEMFITLDMEVVTKDYIDSRISSLDGYK